MNKKKLLYSIIIPCFNGEKFLVQCIHSIINQRILEKKITHLYEIIIINDGSTDKSLEVADQIRRHWNAIVGWDFIRIIDKPNGQYGSVINRGVEEARGLYFKVLDVDDTFNSDSFIKLLYISASLPQQVDVIISDHTFEKVGINKKYLKSFRNYIEPNKVINTQYIALPRDIITMHSIVYRLDFLKSINFKQSENIYYSDSEYAILPLLKVKAFYYVKLPLYRYYIGRNEQSINLKNMIKNHEQQLHVLKTVWQSVDLEDLYSKRMILYAVIALRRLAQWRLFLIVQNPKIKNKSKDIMDLIDLLKSLQPKYHKLIINGALFNLVKFTRGHGIVTMIKYGAKIYAHFKSNIIAEWG